MKKTAYLYVVLSIVGMSTIATLSAQELRPRKALVNPHNAGTKITVVQSASRMRVGEQPSADKMGQLTLFHREDFSLMTAGSESEPDTVGTICAPDGIYKFRIWQNIDPQYTHWRGWGGAFKATTFEECQGKGYTHSAGGTIHLGSRESAKLNTPPLDLMNVVLHNDVKDDNIIVLRFRAKVIQNVDPTLATVRFFVEAAETSWYRDGDNPTYKGEWDVLRRLTPNITTLSTDWQTYEMVFAGAGHSTILNMGFQVMPASREIAETEDYHFGMLLDDIEVYKMQPYLPIPKVQPHTSFTTDSFVANWSPIEGADSYLLDVYYMVVDESVPPGPMGQRSMIRKELLQGQPVTGTNFKVTGINPQYTYYYNVRAVKGAKESYRSLDQAVDGITVPELKGVSELSSGHYVASWSEVPSAGRYSYMAYHDKRVYQDMEVTIIDEDFTGVKDLNGNATGWTVDNPPTGSYGKAFPRDLNMPGWKMYSYAPCSNYVGFDAWQYINRGESASMQSPELDLSHGGGIINVSMSLYSAYDKNSNQFPQVALALFNYNEETERYDQVDLVYPAEETGRPIVNNWQDYTVQLKNGSKRSIIALFAVKAPEYLFVDNFKVTQHFKKGESYLAPYFGDLLIDGTSVAVEVPNYVQEDALYHRVKAVKATEHKLMTSAFSPWGLVRKATSTSRLTLIEPKAQLQDGVLTITNPSKEVVYVYDATGQIIYSNESGEQTIEVELPATSVYVVHIGPVVYKML